jgi:hypothetical protein
MNFFSLRCVLHDLPFILLVWTFCLYLAKNTSYKAPHYVVFLLQRISSSSRPPETFRNKLFLRWIVSPTPKPQPDDHPLSAARDYLFSVFTVLRVSRPSPPSATWGRATCQLYVDWTRHMLTLKFSRLWSFGLWSFGLWHYPVLWVHSVLEGTLCHIFRVGCGDSVFFVERLQAFTTRRSVSTQQATVQSLYHLSLNVAQCKSDISKLTFLKYCVLMAVAMSNTASGALSYNVRCWRSWHYVSLKRR